MSAYHLSQSQTQSYYTVHISYITNVHDGAFAVVLASIGKLSGCIRQLIT